MITFGSSGAGRGLWGSGMVPPLRPNYLIHLGAMGSWGVMGGIRVGMLDIHASNSTSRAALHNGYSYIAEVSFCPLLTS